MEHNGQSDVVIIGGSAAGLFAAYLLAREGVRVRLFDAGDPLEPSDRTLIVTSHLNEVLGFVPTEAIVNRISRIDLFSPGRSATVQLNEPDLVVERSKVFRLLAELAVQAGAEIRTGYQFTDLTSNGDGAMVALKETGSGRMEQVKATTLIGCPFSTKGPRGFQLRDPLPLGKPTLSQVSLVWAFSFPQRFGFQLLWLLSWPAVLSSMPSGWGKGGIKSKP